MELDTYVEDLRRQLLVAAGAGGEESRTLAERLLPALDPAARLVLLEAVSAAADEITRELAPRSVEVRLRGRNPGFVVMPPPDEPAFDAAPELPPLPRVETEDGGTSRINLRLADALKARAEEAANREGLSLNTWLVRAVGAAVAAGDRESPTRRPGPRGSQHYTGWVR